MKGLTHHGAAIGAHAFCAPAREATHDFVKDVDDIEDFAPTESVWPRIAHQSYRASRNPALMWDAIESRIAHVFGELQIIWSGRDAERIRPYVSEHLPRE